MSAVTGLTVVKRFTYRGDALEEFSNTYHFKGSPPGDDASWLVLLNDVLAQEKLIVPADVFFVRAYGYNSDDPNAHHVYAHDFTIPGPPPPGLMAPTGGPRMAGDQAALVAWKLNRLSARGKPLYLRKYFHGGYVMAGGGDELDTAYLNHLTIFAGSSGIQGVHGGLRSRSTDDSVTAATTHPHVTTRTLKRRGKRPRTSP